MLTNSSRQETHNAVDLCLCRGMSMPPPMVIFKGSKVENEARDATPSGWMICHLKSRYIHTKLFAEMGKKLVKFINEKKLDKNGKHLLLPDPHSNHSFNLHFMCYRQGSSYCHSATFYHVA